MKCGNCGKDINVRRKYCSHRCNALANNPLGDHLKEKKVLLVGLGNNTQQDRLAIARASLAKGYFEMEKTVEVVDPDELMRLKRVNMYRKAGRCVEVDKMGNETYYDENGNAI